MQRRSFIKNTGLTLGAMSLLSKSTLASFLADPTYKIKMLTEEIGVFTESGGTILFMITKKGSVVIDSQFPATAKHCIDEIMKKTKKPFLYLVNTHHHGDHSGGNIAFKGMVKNVVAHKNSKINQEAVAVKNKSEDKQLYPDTVYDTNWSTKLKGETLTLNYFGAGHTNGDSFVHFEKANIVHVGDLVFNLRHPFIDRTASANIAEWIKTLTAATSKFSDTTTYVCGHAATGFDIVVKKEDILQFREYLSNLLKYTSESIARGTTKEEFLKTTTVPGSPEWKGDGISRPLEAAWAELMEKK
jgi:cyclase